MLIYIGIFIITLLIGMYWTQQKNTVAPTAEVARTYTLEELERLMKDRTQILQGTADNVVDPFGELARTLLVNIRDTETPLPVFIINAPLWNEDDLGTSITMTGSKLTHEVERNGKTGAEDFAYYTILTIDDETPPTVKATSTDKEITLDPFSCKELGFAFDLPHVNGYLVDSFLKSENTCTIRYIWIGARERIDASYSVEAVASDKVVKPAPPITRNTQGIFYRENADGVDFHLPNKTITVTFHTLPEGSGTSFKDTVIETFREWTTDDVEPTTARSETPDAVILNEYCPPNDGGRTIMVLKNNAGQIGGYTVTLPITDTPITYLNPQGKVLTSFHIFGSDEEKAIATRIIDDLRKEFPIETPLICPK